MICVASDAPDVLLWTIHVKPSGVMSHAAAFKRWFCDCMSTIGALSNRFVNWTL